jgi:predicted acyltransferase
MSTERFVSIDAFRGMTVAAMVLVNNPASWEHVFPPLRHAEWHGWTPTDLIFPFFLFIVGMSISLSLARRMDEKTSRTALYAKIVKRSIIIFALGMFLRLFPDFHFTALRIPGVLQRIAVCFLCGAFLYLNLKVRPRIALSFLLLAGYWALLTFVPAPGHAPGDLSLEGNLPGHVDAWLLSGHLYRPGFDPEGLLSTIPAIVTVLLGTMAGDWLRTMGTIVRKTMGIFALGIPLTVAGLLLDPLFPINKALWTSSYVLFTAGAALLVFGVFFFLMEGLRWRRAAWPVLVLGANAIAVFVGSTLMAKILLVLRVSDGGAAVSPVTYLYRHVLTPLAGPTWGSLIYPILLVLLWIGLMAPLYKHKLFIKI